MLTGYRSVERIYFEKEVNDNVDDVVSELIKLIDKNAVKAFTMTILILEKDEEKKQGETC